VVCRAKRKPVNAINYAKFYSRSHDTVIRVFDDASNPTMRHLLTGFPVYPFVFRATLSLRRARSFPSRRACNDNSGNGRLQNSVRNSGTCSVALESVLSLCGSLTVCRYVMQHQTFATASIFRKFFSRSHHAVIRVYDEAGNVIETHEHALRRTAQCD
jgi:hypothetical protein